MGPINENADLESHVETTPLSTSQPTNIVKVFESHFDLDIFTSLPGTTMSESGISKCIATRPLRSIYIVLIKSKINVLLPFGPLAIFLHYLTGKHGWVFLFSLLGITPLAERLGYATEQLSFYTGTTVGGLLNATFGNATEMIISMYALQHGMIRVVQQSLLGSILSNMLLVLGFAFLFGGLVHREKIQEFNKEKDKDQEDPDEFPELTYWEAISWLAILTLWVSVLSGFLVDTIQTYLRGPCVDFAHFVGPDSFKVTMDLEVRALGIKVIGSSRVYILTMVLE